MGIPAKHADADDEESGGAVEEERGCANRLEGERGPIILERLGGKKKRRREAGAEKPRDGPFCDGGFLLFLIRERRRR